MKTSIFNLPTLSILFFVTFSLIIFVPNWSAAQSNAYLDDRYSVAYSNTVVEATTPKTNDHKTIKAEAVNTIATYKEGKSAFDNYISQNVTYPEMAKTYAFEGTTIVRFKVMPNGTLDQFTVVQSTHPICDKEVIKTLKQMPHWNAAKKNGKSVESVQEVSVDFRLN